jgi:hypothetical protein
MIKILRDSFAEPVDPPRTELGPMSIRDILSDMGVPPPLASMATPGLFFTPAESDPAAQNTMVIVQGVQKCLNQMGYNVKMNGLMDAGTQNAIAEVAGRNWASMPWNYIYTVCRMAGAQRMRPRSQINWKQSQSTAIGEALGATLTPTDALIPYTLPSTSIDCVGSGSSEYCFGKNATVTAAFKSLQTVLGVAVDGKIGPVTASKAAAEARSLWYQRDAKRLTAAEANHLGAVFTAWDKYKRPFVIAASANMTAAILKKYRSVVTSVVSAAKSAVASLTTPSVEEAIPTVTQSGFGTGMFAIAGLAILGGLYFFGGGGSGSGKKSASQRTRRRRR